MQTEILYTPAYSLARVRLAAGEAIRAEAGTMVSMSAGVTIETAASGGLLASLKRSVLGGESFFMNTFRASSGGEVTFAPPLPGDMNVRELRGESLLLQSGAYIASEQGIQIDTKWGGAKTFFANEGLILLRCSGQGTLLFSSYGAIHEMMLETGQTYTVDTGHLVAFGEGMNFRVRRVGGLKSTLFSGEGLVVDLTGPGRLYMQTRSADALLSWLMPQVQKRLPSHRD